jgi:hypothetical protein
MKDFSREIPSTALKASQLEWRSMRNLAVFLVLGSILLAPNLSGATEKKEGVPVAPLPAVIVNAKKVFLSNGGGSSIAYDAFYSEMKEWSRYKIVGSPEESDLIVELSYRVEDSTRVWNSTNTYYITTQVHTKQNIDPQLVLTIFDAKMKNSLWSQTDHPGFAKREKNREKEAVNSAQRLVDDLKTRVERTALNGQSLYDQGSHPSADRGSPCVRLSQSSNR